LDHPLPGHELDGKHALGLRLRVRQVWRHRIHRPEYGRYRQGDGLFAGKDHGAPSSATAYTNMTASQFHATCPSSADLSRQTIVSGTTRFS
jgi:hypothetical protein